MVTLESERLIIRNYKDSDLLDYHKMMSDKDNMYYMTPFGVLTNTIEESQALMNVALEFNTKNTGFQFCVALKKNDKLIGSVGYEVPTITPVGKVCERIGWLIRSEYQNKGYVTEAIQRVLEFAFLQDNCIRVATACFKENIPTQKVMAKLGFRKEAEKLKAMWLDGEMRDRLEFAINKDEYMQMKQFIV